jgi:hypothetical protein
MKKSTKKRLDAVQSALGTRLKTIEAICDLPDVDPEEREDLFRAAADVESAISVIESYARDDR